MKKVFRVIVSVAMSILTFCRYCWGVIGHRIVGEIADSYLSKNARKEIANILGSESLAMSANWADFIKSDPAYKYLGNWHYVNLPGGMTHDQVTSFFAADTATDAFTKINFMVSELKNNRRTLSAETKQLYLRLLVHIIGDVHQPMHVGRPDDRGGNGIKLRWFDDGLNLHQVWDERLIDFQQLSYTEYARAINHVSKEQQVEWQRQPVAEWMWESYSLAEKIYADVKPDQRLDYLYNFKYLAPLNNALLKGGVHLAGVLNDIFK